MADLRNCRRCGKMFNSLNSSPICNPCKKEDEEVFKQVKEYLYENPRASLTEIANDLEINVNRIKGYIRDGRLEILEGSNLVLDCQRCGTSIKSGKLCKECSKGLTNELSESGKALAKEVKPTNETEEEETTRSGGMRYLNKKHKK